MQLLEMRQLGLLLVYSRLNSKKPSDFTGLFQDGVECINLG